jgi:hypothetical protein
MKEYTYTCNECSKVFTRSYIITTKPSNPKYEGRIRKIYCSKECRQTSRGREGQFVHCINCNTQFRVPNKNNANKFCSNKCVSESMKKNSSELKLADRAANARKSWNDNSWKKSVETRTKNGHVINWDKAEWKQYWKRCDWLTRKIRQQMLEIWDGYDYIDNEYIKDNLTLHFTHGDYPTLDHLKSRSQCFKENISPYDATKPENLKWTKRRNNSSKNKNSI